MSEGQQEFEKMTVTIVRKHVQSMMAFAAESGFLDDENLIKELLEIAAAGAKAQVSNIIEINKKISAVVEARNSKLN